MTNSGKKSTNPIVENVEEVFYATPSHMYFSECDNRSQEPNAMQRNTMTEETYSSLVANLITEIENAGLGICQSAHDTVVTIQNQKMRGAAILLRPLADGGCFQLCFLFGDTKWCRWRSMYVELMQVTFHVTKSLLSGEENLMEVSCSCKSFLLENDCEHLKFTTGFLENKIQIMALAPRYVRSIRNDGVLQDWEMVAVLSNLKDDVHLWHTFRRNYLSSTCKTSATVLLDTRK